MTIQSPLVFGIFILASSERYLHHCAPPRPRAAARRATGGARTAISVSAAVGPVSEVRLWSAPADQSPGARYAAPRDGHMDDVMIGGLPWW